MAVPNAGALPMSGASSKKTVVHGNTWPDVRDRVFAFAVPLLSLDNTMEYKALRREIRDQLQKSKKFSFYNIRIGTWTGRKLIDSVCHNLAKRILEGDTVTSSIPVGPPEVTSSTVIANSTALSPDPMRSSKLFPQRERIEAIKDDGSYQSSHKRPKLRAGSSVLQRPMRSRSSSERGSSEPPQMILLLYPLELEPDVPTPAPAYVAMFRAPRPNKLSAVQEYPMCVGLFVGNERRPACIAFDGLVAGGLLLDFLGREEGLIPDSFIHRQMRLAKPALEDVGVPYDRVARLVTLLEKDTQIANNFGRLTRRNLLLKFAEVTRLAADPNLERTYICYSCSGTKKSYSIGYDHFKISARCGLDPDDSHTSRYDRPHICACSKGTDNVEWMREHVVTCKKYLTWGYPNGAIELV